MSDLVYRVYRVSWSGLELLDMTYDTPEEVLKHINHDDNKDVAFNIYEEWLDLGYRTRVTISYKE